MERINEAPGRDGPGATGSDVHAAKLNSTRDTDPAKNYKPDTVPASPHCPPVTLTGRVGANGYVPENDAWFDVLTEPHPLGVVGSDGKIRRVGRDPMTVPTDTLRASGHVQREARRVIRAIGDEPIDPTIKRLTELRRHCLTCAENAAEVRRCAIINCPLWPYRMGRNPHNPQRGRNPFDLKGAAMTDAPGF